jgi:hypothetical protein
VLAVPIEYDKADGDYQIMTNSTTTLYSATIAVYTVHALFQESDKAILGLTDEVDIATKKHHQGLSLGAQIGIGIGVTAAVILILGGIMFLYARHRLRHHMETYPRISNDREIGQLPPVHPSDIRSFNTGGNRSLPPKAVSESSATTADTNAPAMDTEATALDRSNEIKALRSQQADIQRRIEQLEKTADENRGG